MCEFTMVEEITAILMDPHRVNKEGRTTIITLETPGDGAVSTGDILEHVAAHLGGMTSADVLKEGLLQCKRGRVLVVYDAVHASDGKSWRTVVRLDGRRMGVYHEDYATTVMGEILPYPIRHLLRVAERSSEHSPCLPVGHPDDYQFYHKSGHIGLDVVFLTSTRGLRRILRRDVRQKKKTREDEAVAAVGEMGE
jgi:hypothetical protein